MTSKEIFERIEEVIERKGLSKRVICDVSGIPYSGFITALWKGNSGIYRAMDILDAVGLELQFDNIPVRDHQEFINIVNSRNPVSQKLSRATGLNMTTIRRFRNGENTNFGNALMIVEALGIEVRVV